MSKDFLSVEDQAKVTEAAEKDLETAAAEAPPADGGTTPAPHAEEPAGSTSGEEPVGEEPKATATDPVTGQKVPYDRFHQVVSEKNEALEKVRQYEERLTREVEQAARARSQAILEDIARRRPNLAEEIYGPNSEQAKALAPEKLPDDPIQRELAILKREAAEQKSWRTTRDQKDMVSDIENRAQAAMEKYPILSKNERVAALAETAIVQRILAKPQTPVEKVVEEVASDFRHFEESIKAEYKQAKVESVKKVPAGVGSGGAAPPGAPKKRFTLDRPGELARALANGLTTE
jgi:hypothetical protein